MAAEQQGKQQRPSQEDIQKAAAPTVGCTGTCWQETRPMAAGREGGREKS